MIPLIMACLTCRRPSTHQRRKGFAARVAQFRPVTSSGDSNSSSQDLELGPIDAEHLLYSTPAEQLSQVVQQEAHRLRLEQVFQAAGVVPPNTHATASNRSAEQSHLLGSRDLSSPVEDETLPLLAETATHPVSSLHQGQLLEQQQSQQQQTAVAAAPEPVLVGGIPRSIFVLSMVSMALTSASCVFNTLLPIYMVTELKMTMRTMGMFEGMLEAFSYVVRMFSGVISDHMASRKAAITAGFMMGAAAKFGMSFCTTTISLFMTKAIDRLGNGVQAAPRDALIGDLSPSSSRSACFGFAQSMRKWGSFMGAGLAFALMKASGNNYRAIFLLAAGVSALSTCAFVLFVPSHKNPNQQVAGSKAAASAAAAAAQHQPEKQQQTQQQPFVQQQEAAGVRQLLDNVSALLKDVRSMGVDFYRTLSVIALYGLGHINESLLEARAIEVGFGKAESTLVVALLCFSVFLCAYPLGRLDDKYGHATTFALGMAALVAGDLVLLFSGAWPAAVFAACGFWGVHWAVVQGPMLSAVVGMAPPHLKGTAFGIFYTMMAVVAMVANTMFGSVWHMHSATAAFGLSALIIVVTMVLTPLLLPASAKVGRRAAAGGAAAGGLKPAAA
eukprot:GHUV01020483.1.p1 GENE.GHUV01020483.1~~GHUV01020483.1.p1  ORF type:complete len:614 (+),score=191.77 GHUV01020483.1:715-2556(+)